MNRSETLANMFNDKELDVFYNAITRYDAHASQMILTNKAKTEYEKIFWRNILDITSKLQNEIFLAIDKQQNKLERGK